MMRIGQRVRVTDGGLTGCKQFGTTVAVDSTETLDVRFDTDQQWVKQTVFRVDELHSTNIRAIRQDKLLDTAKVVIS